ncbi:MAG TPA: hypothetical protein VFW91_03945 [Candidatus Binatia bacterium]|jgi:hypothetical protein|nr:hypothetical protein [Candidatus Binatia bacterium]
MRMPILSYFLVVGTALFGVLVLISNQIEPKPLHVTQTVGIPAPFKAPPEPEQTTVSTSNFAAEYPVTDVHVPDPAPKQKRTNKS